MKIVVHLRSQNGAVQAYCPDLPGCSASARTEQAALKRLRARVDEYFASAPQAALPGTRVIHLEV